MNGFSKSSESPIEFSPNISNGQMIIFHRGKLRSDWPDRKTLGISSHILFLRNKLQDLLLFQKFGHQLLTFSALQSMDKFLIEQQIFGLTRKDPDLRRHPFVDESRSPRDGARDGALLGRHHVRRQFVQRILQARQPDVHV